MKRLDTIALGALIAAYALGPLATQIVTPAVPFVHRDLAVPMAAAQALVSLAFVFIAAATLVYGPLSDRHGRRPVILVGTSLFCVGSLVAAAAPGAAWLIVGRCLQSAGSAAALSLTRTVIHDVYGRERSTRVLAQLTTVMIFVPMLAPALGGVLLDRLGWRSVFSACLAVGLVALSLLGVFLPESRRAQAGATGLADAFASYRALLADRDYRAPTLHFAWVMAAIFATQAAIPYLVIEVLGRSATEYGACFGVACLAYIGGNQFTARWGQRYDARQLVRASGFGCLAAALVGAVGIQVAGVTMLTLFVPTIALYFCAAVGIAPVQAEAVAAQPARSGAASGLLTATQMVIGAASVQAIGFAHDGTSRPLLVALVACSAAAILSYGAVSRRARLAAREC
ncbi:MAG TPA: MFS transporter [Steroidobacteraceae bacterium]|nr:MFS transporter [Steroidobacteraceae bacterium]